MVTQTNLGKVYSWAPCGKTMSDHMSHVDFLDTIVNDVINFVSSSCKTAIETVNGLMSQVIKNRLFNQVGLKQTSPPPP